jgi:hypothetical protein
VPKKLCSDKGKSFTADVVKQLAEVYDFEKTETTSYHPMSNGLVERFNSTLENMLRCFVNTEQANWDRVLPNLMLAYRSSIQESTGFSPFFLVYGQEAVLPIDLLVPNNSDKKSISSYVSSMKRTFQNAASVVHRNTKQSMKVQKHQYDRKLHGPNYKSGSLVWLYTPLQDPAKSRKLHRPWSGPWVIKTDFGNSVFRIQRVENGVEKTQNIHFNRLRRYEGRQRAIGHCSESVSKSRSARMGLRSSPRGGQTKVIALDVDPGEDSSDQDLPTEAVNTEYTPWEGGNCDDLVRQVPPIEYGPVAGTVESFENETVNEIEVAPFSEVVEGFENETVDEMEVPPICNVVESFEKETVDDTEVPLFIEVADVLENEVIENSIGSDHLSNAENPESICIDPPDLPLMGGRDTHCLDPDFVPPPTAENDNNIVLRRGKRASKPKRLGDYYYEDELQQLEDNDYF